MIRRGPAAASRILGLVEDQRNSAAPGQGTVPEPWNHNVHYHRVIIDSIPPGCARALDVGCGTGALTRRLRQFVPHVTVAKEISDHRVVMVKERILPYLPDEHFYASSIDLVAPDAGDHWVSVRTFPLAPLP